jgi:hypothetical protein
MYKGVDRAVLAMFWTCVIFVPLGTWKILDIILWIIDRMRVFIS